jgi:quercetin dioxygenase-like cupin family protein
MTFERTADGDDVRFERTSGDTGGALLQMRVRYRPSGKAPPLHRHPQQEEHFEVVSGQLWVRIGDSEEVKGAGATFVVPKGTPHAMRSAGDAGAEVVWQVRPALASEALFRSLWGLDDGNVGLAKRLAVLGRHRREIELVGPPRWLQTLLFAIAAPLASARRVRRPPG